MSNTQQQLNQNEIDNLFRYQQNQIVSNTHKPVPSFCGFCDGKKIKKN